jgi:hypothetical protein
MSLVDGPPVVVCGRDVPLGMFLGVVLVVKRPLQNLQPWHGSTAADIIIHAHLHTTWLAAHCNYHM